MSFATPAVSYKPTGIAEPEIRVPAPQPVKPRVYVSKEDRVEAIKGGDSVCNANVLFHSITAVYFLSCTIKYIFMKTNAL